MYLVLIINSDGYKYGYIESQHTNTFKSCLEDIVNQHELVRGVGFPDSTLLKHSAGYIIIDNTTDYSEAINLSSLGQLDKEETKNMESQFQKRLNVIRVRQNWANDIKKIEEVLGNYGKDGSY